MIFNVLFFINNGISIKLSICITLINQTEFHKSNSLKINSIITQKKAKPKYIISNVSEIFDFAFSFEGV